jgi:hypothetical protein
LLSHGGKFSSYIHIYIYISYADHFSYLRVNQVASNSKRGILTGFAVSCGQIGGIITLVVSPSSDSPQYIPGISTCIAFAVMGIISAVVMWFFRGWENRQRDMGKRDHLRQLPQDEQDKLGERHPDFRYVLCAWVSGLELNIYPIIVIKPSLASLGVGNCEKHNNNYYYYDQRSTKVSRYNITLGHSIS